MALKDTMAQMHHIMKEICDDLDKAGAGNRAAAQRTRTNSIKFGKIAKVFRKESVAAEKSGTLKKGAKAKAKPAAKKVASKAKAAPKKATGKKVVKKAVKKVAVKAKTKAKAKKR